MTTRSAPDLPPVSTSPAERRPAWRRRLVEAERGIAQGFRSDSTLYVHFFTGSTILAAGLVLGLSLWQWTTLILALTLVLAAEMFCQVLRILGEALRRYAPEAAVKSQRLATAAVFVTIFGALLVTGLIFGQRLWILFVRG